MSNAVGTAVVVLIVARVLIRTYRNRGPRA